MQMEEKRYFLEWLKKVNSATEELIELLKEFEPAIENKDKYKVQEFAKIIGCTQKTVYSLIKRNEVKTIKERVKGRKINFIIASNTQIKKIQQNYNG